MIEARALGMGVSACLPGCDGLTIHCSLAINPDHGRDIGIGGRKAAFGALDDACGRYGAHAGMIVRTATQRSQIARRAGHLGADDRLGSSIGPNP